MYVSRYTARTGRAKNVWLLAVMLVFPSTNLSHLPWYAAKLGVKVKEARKNAATANVEQNTAFWAGAQEKQLSVNKRFDGEWSAAYKTFEMQPAGAESKRLSSQAKRKREEF